MQFPFVHKLPSVMEQHQKARIKRALPPHECLVDGGPQVEDVVADGQVVLQPEGLQHHPVPYREGQPELLVGVH